ncbi:MAG: 3-hydroxy-3-methylglutaryl-CoA reductase, partial [Thermoplasmata archaeon]
MDSRIPGFYKLSMEERRKKVSEFSSLTDDDLKTLISPIPFDIADRMIENVIYLMDVPVGIATNFLINGKDYL